MRVLTKPLEGVTVAIPESRFGSEFATLFERAGARVRHCPLMKERVLEDRSSIGAFISLATKSLLGVVIFMTGIGTDLILQTAADTGTREELLRALSRMTIVSRGSKSTAALRRAGVRIDVIPAVATSDGIVEALRRHDLQGKRVAVQLYGTPNPLLREALASRGALVNPISVYSYELASSPDAIEEFIREVVGGEVDIIVFTSATQVHSLFEAAGGLGLTDSLRSRLQTDGHVASLGQVTSRALEVYGVRPHIVPDEPKMGPMVNAICTIRSS